MTLNLKNIKKFIVIRNKGRLSSNLQFTIDLNTAGLSSHDLPEVVKIGAGHYEWNLGAIGTLVERDGLLTLE